MMPLRQPPEFQSCGIVDQDSRLSLFAACATTSTCDWSR
jgi:hypothetical protein